MKKLVAPLLLIIALISFFSFQHYSNISLLKNQKTIVNFFDKNHWHINALLDLSSSFFVPFFESNYKVFAKADVYILNETYAGLLSFGFDSLEFDKLNLQFYIDSEAFYYRISQNTFDDALEMSLLNPGTWTKVLLAEITASAGLADLDLFKLFALEADDDLIISWSSYAMDFFDSQSFIVPDLYAVLESENKLIWKDPSIIDLEISTFNFKGELPISAPLNFKEF